MTDVASFRPPDSRALRVLSAPARRWFSPDFLDVADVTPERPVLLVGNHSLYGVLDASLMVEHIYATRGVFARSLGDHAHFKIPGWGHLLKLLGAVDGTPENCAALMRARQTVLVFPGGAREVYRRKDELYRLIWKQRTGFARMAMDHGYDILPFAALGADEAFDIRVDAADLTHNPLIQRAVTQTPLWAATKGGEQIPPIVFGVGPTLVPKPQRLYFGFGERISTDDATDPWTVRDLTAQSIDAQLERLLAHREADHGNWSPLRRKLAPIMVKPGRDR